MVGSMRYAHAGRSVAFALLLASGAAAEDGQQLEMDALVERLQDGDLSNAAEDNGSWIDLRAPVEMLEPDSVRAQRLKDLSKAAAAMPDIVFPDAITNPE